MRLNGRFPEARAQPFPLPAALPVMAGALAAQGGLAGLRRRRAVRG